MKRKSVLNFPVLITQDEDGIFVADVPAIPSCHTQGETYEEVLRNVKDVIGLCLSVAKTDVKYRKQINWPDSVKAPKLLGVINVPISSTLTAT